MAESWVVYDNSGASLAWDAFEEKNGVGSADELRTRIRWCRRADDANDGLAKAASRSEPAS